MPNAEESGNAATWFLGKLVREPAAYLGAAAALAIGWGALSADTPIGGAIGFGLITGLCIGFISFVASLGIRRAYQMRGALRMMNSVPPEPTEALSGFRDLGRDDLAELFEKIRDACLAVNHQAGRQPGNPDLRHTNELVQAVLVESTRKVIELEDLSRRKEDPILDLPPGSEAIMGKIEKDLESAYRSVADARSRLMRGDRLSEANFLQPAEQGTRLGVLAAQLQEETSIAKGVEERLLPGTENIVFPDSPEDSANEESPQWERE